MEGFGCVFRCPRGYYADEVLGWCVKCSCECETCSESKYQCDKCHKPADLNDEGECVVGTEYAPYAIFNEGWDSFNLYYPMAGYDIGFRSDFVHKPNSPFLTCKDRILDLDWNSAEFIDQLEIIQEKFRDLTTDHEYEKLLEIIDNMGPINFDHYKHDFETIQNSWKVLYTAADSIFGRSFDENLVECDNMNQDAIASWIDFDTPKLCEKIFAESQAELNDMLGVGKKCTFLLGDESRDFNDPPYPITAVHVEIDLESADYTPDLELTVSSNFYRYDGDEGVLNEERFFNAPLDEY